MLSVVMSPAVVFAANTEKGLTFTPGAVTKSPAMLNVDATLLTFSPNGEYALFKKGTDYFVYQVSNWKQLANFQASANYPDFALLDDDQKILVKSSAKGYIFFDTLKGVSSKREFNSDLVFFLRENEIYFHKVVFPNTLNSRIMSCSIDKLDLTFQATPDNIYQQSCVLLEIKEFYGESQHVSRIDHGKGNGYEFPNKYVSYTPNRTIKYTFAGTRWSTYANDWFPTKSAYRNDSIEYYLPSSAYSLNFLDTAISSIKTNNARYVKDRTEEAEEEFKKNVLYIFNRGYIRDGYIIPTIPTPKYPLDKNKLCFTLNGKNSQNISNFEIIPHASLKFVAFSCGDFTTFYKAEDLLNPYLGYDKDVAIDMAMAKITKSISNNDNKDALLYMNYLLTLDEKLPEAFYPQYIKVLEATKNVASAKRVANVYIQKYGKAGKFYGEMIEVLSR